MQFETLKEKCEFYRTLGEHRLMPNGHIIMMLDGRSFSKMINIPAMMSAIRDCAPRPMIRARIPIDAINA